MVSCRWGYNGGLEDLDVDTEAFVSLESGFVAIMPVFDLGIELRKGGERKLVDIGRVADESKGGRFERLGRTESFYPCMNVGVFLDWCVKLPVTIVRAVDRLERYKLRRVR